MKDQPSDIVATVRGPPTVGTAMIFVRDGNSEGVIRKSLNDLDFGSAEFISAGIDTAIKTLSRQPSPCLLVVDISGITDPVVQVNALADVCEPSVGVVLIGDSNDIRLYRSLKDIGIVEYFFKPLVSNLLTQTFLGILTGSSARRSSRTGKLVFVLGVRGGVGATTIAVNTAWHLAESSLRRVLFLDLDMQFGDAALQLNVTPTHALSEAMEHPERVDDLFLERAIIPVTERLGLLAALEPLANAITLDDQAILMILGNLLHRYRYVVVDVPMAAAQSLMRVLTLPSILLLVSTGSLVSGRDVTRWRQHVGPNNSERSTLHILNKTGGYGYLPEAAFAKVVDQPPDLTVPFAREVASASNLGVPAMQKCVSFTRGLRPLFQEIAGENIERSQSFLSRIFR